MKRRDALNKLFLSTGALVVLPAAFSACEKEDTGTGTGNGNGDTSALTIDLGDAANSALTNSGGYLIKNDIIVINTGTGFIALSKVCTHNGCSVSFNASNNNLPCPCHGSVFGLDGSVLNGPASSPLTVYTVTREGDILTIS